MSSWLNVVLETLYYVRNDTSSLEYFSWSFYFGLLCQYNHVANLQDTVTTLYRYVVEIKMKADFKDGHSQSKSAGSN